MKLKILVTAGDGIGPEVTNEAVAVLKEIAALGGHEFAFTEKRIGGVAIVQDGTPLPADTLDAALASDAVLLGAVGGNEFNSLPPDKRPEGGLAGDSRGAGRICESAPVLLIQGAGGQQPVAAGRSSKARTSCSCANCWAGLYFGKPREWDKEKGEAGTRWSTRRTKWCAWRAWRLSWRRSGARS